MAYILSRETSPMSMQTTKKEFEELKAKVEAEHIAIGTIQRVDVLVSWNFKHVDFTIL